MNIFSEFKAFLSCFILGCLISLLTACGGGGGGESETVSIKTAMLNLPLELFMCRSY